MSSFRLPLLACALALAIAPSAHAADPFGAPADLGVLPVGIQPQVAVGPGGQAIAAWRTGSEVVVAERASRTGAWSAPRALGPSGGFSSVRVAMDGLGRAEVAWVGGNAPGDLRAASRSENGTWAGTQLLSATADGAFDVAFGYDRAYLVYAKTDGTVLSFLREPGDAAFTMIPDTVEADASVPIDIDLAGSSRAIALAYDRGGTLRVSTRVQAGPWSGPDNFAPVGAVLSPSVALTTGDIPVVAWEGGGAVRFGSVQANALQQDTTPDAGTRPVLAADASGHVVAVWRDGSALRSRARDAGTTEAWTSPYTVAADVNVNQPFGLAISGTGEATAIWASTGLTTVRHASGAWNASFGTPATLATGTLPSIASNIAGDLVAGYVASDELGAPHVFAAGTAPAAAPPATAPTGGGGASPAETTTTPATTTPAPAADVRRVFGVDFVVVALDERRVRMPAVKAIFGEPAVGLLRDKLPFSDIGFKLDKGGCAKGTAPGTVVGQSPAAGTMVVSAQGAPVAVTLTLCLPSEDFVKACDARPIEKTLKRVDDYALASSIIQALAKCKVDWDVKFVKQATAPEIGKVDVRPTPAKRDPMDSVLECPTDPALQNLRVAWTVGARAAGAAGFHASDSGVGWTLPGPFARTNRVKSYVHMTVIDRAKQFYRAVAYVDTDGVGAPQMAPLSFDAKGERSFTITPDRTGLIRVCVVFEPKSGPPQFATAAVRVVDPPADGGLWPMTNGRVLKRQGGTFVNATATARAASVFDDIGGWLQNLFGGTSKIINAQASAPASKQVVTAAGNGYEVGQIAFGGTLGGLPQLPTRDLGTVIVVGPDGKIGYGTGGVLKGSPAGTLVGAGNGVVAAGGGNVVAAGGGNVVAAGGGNVVAAGGGNVVAAGGGNVVASGGLNALPASVSGLISDNGLGVVASGGGNVVFAPGAYVVASGGGNVVASGGLN